MTVHVRKNALSVAGSDGSRIRCGTTKESIHNQLSLIATHGENEVLLLLNKLLIKTNKSRVVPIRT